MPNIIRLFADAVPAVAKLTPVSYLRFRLRLDNRMTVVVAMGAVFLATGAILLFRVWLLSPKLTSRGAIDICSKLRRGSRCWQNAWQITSTEILASGHGAPVPDQASARPRREAGVAIVSGAPEGNTSATSRL